MKTRVLVLKHDTRGTEELKKDLMGRNDMEIVKWINDGADGVSFIKRYNPEIILLDLLLPNVMG